MEIKISALSERGKIHNENEDCIVYMSVTPYNDVTINIGVICDGMGGMANAKMTACTAAEEFAAGIIKKITHHYETERKNFSILNYRDRLLEAMAYALESANRAVCEIATPGFGSGTTIAAVAVTNDFVTAVNVGDSPIYFYNGTSDSLTMMSTIHNRLSEKNDNMSDDMYDEEGRFLTHYLGEYRNLSDELLRVYTVEKMCLGDKILIMSDGADVLGNERVTDIIKNSADGKSIVSTIMSLSNASQDDKSIILMEMI